MNALCLSIQDMTLNTGKEMGVSHDTNKTQSVFAYNLMKNKLILDHVLL